MNALLHRIYMAGHSKWMMPRRLRRLIAGSEFHRAWLCGFQDRFTENGVSYGPANPYNQWMYDEADLK
ncbi:hypothetical protein ROLI_048020 (plasmid) [Roseobacter fucihabitans]|uniref:Uncharacterized protein n=1 Tax=Roseobacter fucihabitans TaxID=1537242 RepID=A0ABZ2C2W8_9RHOB|nr:hypothetical protein [Roseobacter litoralis]MBC6967293.1 hypothetical protein [Roseobacter litoralis]